MRKALITFDLDGTLMDTAPGTARTVNRTLTSVGLRPLPFDEVIAGFGHGVHPLMRRALAAAVPGLDGPQLEARLADIMPVFFHHYEALLAEPGPLYPGVADALDCLRAAGVRLAVVSNKEWRLARRVLRAAGILDAFDLVVGGDTLAEKKPHPLPILHCLVAFGVDPRQAAHVGDMAVDVQAARRAGVAAWAVPYGYEPDALLAAGPDRVFDSIAALADHVVGGQTNSNHQGDFPWPSSPFASCSTMPPNTAMAFQPST